MAKAPTAKIIDPKPVERKRVSFCVIGTTPLIYHAMSLKVQQQLLLPSGRKSALDKQTQQKHDPYQEFRDSVYRRRESDEGATTLVLPMRMFKDAVSQVAKRVQNGGTTAEMKQYIMAGFENIDLYGIPQIFLCTVRSSDISRTPDIRSRAIVPEWACVVTFDFVSPQVHAAAIKTLMGAAGVLNGVGDFRQQKGSGNYGCFRVTTEDDPDYQRILETTRAQQDAALAEPESYDMETEQLLRWYDEEIVRRPKEAAKTAKKVKAVG